jgi:hypothetical protein
MIQNSAYLQSSHSTVFRSEDAEPCISPATVCASPCPVDLSAIATSSLPITVVPAMLLTSSAIVVLLDTALLFFPPTSEWPKSRDGAMQSLTRCLSTLVSGNPPAALRSQSKTVRGANSPSGSSTSSVVVFSDCVVLLLWPVDEAACGGTYVYRTTVSSVSQFYLSVV